ncbi:Na/Pi cotransporter family protein, partial [Rhizobium sp. BR5]
PVVALANATREVLSVGDAIERMLIRAENAFKHNDLAPLAEITLLEKKVDRRQQEVKVYLSQLGRKGLTDEEARRSIAIIDYAINLEHIGDIIEKGICEQIRKKVLNSFKFSDDGYEELKTLFDMTIENLRAAQSILVTGDFELARRLMESKVDIRRLEKQSSNRHLERLRDGLTESMQTSSLHLDMLRDLKRINAHIVTVAHPILDESGVLIESRLRYAEPRA